MKAWPNDHAICIRPLIATGPRINYYTSACLCLVSHGRRLGTLSEVGLVQVVQWTRRDLSQLHKVFVSNCWINIYYRPWIYVYGLYSPNSKLSAFINPLITSVFDSGHPHFLYDFRRYAEKWYVDWYEIIMKLDWWFGIKWKEDRPNRYEVDKRQTRSRHTTDTRWAQDRYKADTIQIRGRHNTDTRRAQYRYRHGVGT